MTTQPNMMKFFRKFFSKLYHHHALSAKTKNLHTLQTSSKINTSRQHTVVIEGNIGSGKTTFLQHFSQHPAVEALQEPVNEWTNFAGYNLLAMLYEDPIRWSFSFNNYVMLTRILMHQQHTSKPVKLLERSLFSTRHIFVENSFTQGHLSPVEYGLLDMWYQEIVSTTRLDVDLYVYLRTSPEVCYERLRKRNRKEEATVSIDLLRNLHHLYDEALNVDVHRESNTPVLIINADHNFDEMERLFDIHLPTILCGCS